MSRLIESTLTGKISRALLESEDVLTESDGWIAFYKGKKVEITKDEANDLYGAKQVAIQKLNVPKSKSYEVAIEPAYNDENLDDAPASNAQFECDKTLKESFDESIDKIAEFMADYSPEEFRNECNGDIEVLKSEIKKFGKYNLKDYFNQIIDYKEGSDEQIEKAKELVKLCESDEPTAEDLERDDKAIKDAKIKELEDRIAKINVEIGDPSLDVAEVRDLSQDRDFLQAELDDLRGSIDECDKTLKEDSYEETFFQDIEDALVSAGFDVTRFTDAGVLTKNLGWIVSNSEGEVQLNCNGTYLDECDKKLTEGNPEEISDEFISLIAKETGLKSEQVASVVGLLSDYIDDLKDKSFIDEVVSKLKTSLNESVSVITSDGSTVDTQDAASVQSNDGSVTVVTGDTTVVINNTPTEPALDLPQEEPVEEVPAEEVVPEEPIENEVLADEPVENEVIEEADDDYGIDANVEATSLNVIKNQGPTYMLEINEANGNKTYWICDNFNAETNEGENAEVFDNKEAADEAYFKRVGLEPVEA